jgi:hypothetical protein
MPITKQAKEMWSQPDFIRSVRRVTSRRLEDAARHGRQRPERPVHREPIRREAHIRLNTLSGW